MSPDEFVKVGKIGRGTFATVYKVQRPSDGEFFARKDIVTNLDSDIQQRWLQAEIEALKRMAHPNIVRFVHAEPYSRRRGCWRLYQEFCDRGSLEELIEDRAEFGATSPLALHQHELFVWKVALELGLAISRCHYGLGWDDNLERYVYDTDWTPVLHRDIKPANVLLTNSTGAESPLTFCVKLADFGMSYFLDSDAKNPSTYGGTRLYWAPEIRRETGDGARRVTQWSWATDMWAVGCTLYKLLEGDTPNLYRADSGEGTSSLAFRPTTIFSAETPFPSIHIAEEFQKKLRDNIRECLAVNPSLRLNGLELAIRASDGIRKLGEYSPELSPLYSELIRPQDLLNWELPVLTQPGTDGGPQRHIYSEHKMKATISALIFSALTHDNEVAQERKRHQAELEEMRHRLEDTEYSFSRALRALTDGAAKMQAELKESKEEIARLNASVEKFHDQRARMIGNSGIARLRSPLNRLYDLHGNKDEKFRSPKATPLAGQREVRDWELPGPLVPGEKQGEVKSQRRPNPLIIITQFED